MVAVLTTSNSLSLDALTYVISRQLYELAERSLVAGQHAKKIPLENYMGQTVRVNRYTRVNLPTEELVQGIPPDEITGTVENVDITVGQWGVVIRLTDVAELTISHPIVQLFLDRAVMCIGEVQEREACKTLLTATNAVFGGAATTRGALGAADVMTNTVMLNATVQLRSRGAPPFEGDLYGGMLHPQQEGDMLASSTVFQNSSNFARVRKLENAEIGIFSGVQWTRGNFMPKFIGVAAPSATAASATKAQVTIAATGGSLADGEYLVAVVAVDVATGYEVKISQNSAALDPNSNNGLITITTPTSTNYVYDIYMSQVGGTVLYKRVSRVAANTVTLVATQPAGTEVVKPAAPANTVEVFVGWVVGKDAFCRVELNGMSLRGYITPPGPSFPNPLAQGTKAGAKWMGKYAILDHNFIVRMETASAFSAFAPA